MARSGTLRLKPVLPFLLVSASIFCLPGDPVTGHYDLLCVTDYLFTINCSLTITPSGMTPDSRSSYWLTLTEKYEKETFVCNLTGASGNSSSCSVKRSDLDPDSDIFTDMNMFEISLCHKLNAEPEICEVLNDKFKPVENIKPNAPCCLTVYHNVSQHHFTWKSTYEEHAEMTALVKNFEYQLHYYKRGNQHHVASHDIYTDNTDYSVDDQKLTPDTAYAARVRSRPSQAFYQGEWSDWSSEIPWKTELALNDLQTNGLGKKVVIPLCVMVLLLLLLCYAPVKKWSRSAFIPTPAPYFHTLYTDCKGDFKSWVVTQEHTADTLEAEETLHIDSLAQCDVQEEEPQHHQALMEGSVYSNTSLLGTPYAISTMDPDSSAKSLALTSRPGSPAEGDSGCWLCSDTPWYCNEYCTLNSFQQAVPAPTEHHGGLCSHGIGVHTSGEAGTNEKFEHGTHLLA